MPTAGALAAAVLLLAGCGDTPTGVSAIPGRTFSVVLGQGLDLRLQNIGPGEYRAPPTISSGAVRFRSVELVTPAVPAGETQLFHFLAVAPGRAIITFEHTIQTSPVIDTVDVR